MALIPIYHTVASYYAVDPAADPAVNPIVEGMGVALDSDGYVTLTAVKTYCIGIAGDNFSTTGHNSVHNTANTPFGKSIVVSGSGSTQYTQNRVSDFFNETKGSGKMTVYTGVGEFWTDQYNTANTTWTPGSKLYVGTTGLFTDTDPGSGRVCGMIIQGPSAYPSGVPGVDAGAANSISLGNYIRIQLNIVA